jgi:succinate dehydrogenase/fumarate reductase cytochrome b subunit
MNPTLLRALLLLVPASALVVASLILFTQSKNTGSFLQLLGAGCLVLVVLTHVCEGLDLLPWMQWGRPHSIGHYLDLASAVLGVTLVPIGYVLARRRGRRLTCA